MARQYKNITCTTVCEHQIIVLIVGPLLGGGGPQCRLSILRNGNVTLSNLRVKGPNSPSPIGVGEEQKKM